jgi:adenine-specific DNA methylase
LFFEKAEQEVLLVLAEGARDTTPGLNVCRITLTETGKVSEITSASPSAILADASPKTVRHDHEKWLKYFLTEREIGFMRELRVSDAVATLKEHAAVDVGVVTGKNEFFVLNGGEASNLELSAYTMPLISRAAHLKGARINEPEWWALSTCGDRVHLLHLAPLNGSRPTGALDRYIRSGEAKRIHKGYKCSIRVPWYVVPSVWVPDGFVFRQIYDFPRVVVNQARATSTDTIHRLRCRAKPERLVSNIYTHLTAASAEIEGRSYGGGVLKLEPSEAERLLVPKQLRAALPLAECDSLIRGGQLERVLAENDRLILQREMGLSRAECGMLRDIWMKMRNRRLARSRKARSSK